MPTVQAGLWGWGQTPATVADDVSRERHRCRPHPRTGEGILLPLVAPWDGLITVDPPHTARPVGVLVADDRPVFRGAARAVVEATAGFELVGEAASGDQALATMDAVRPDFVLVEVRLKGVGGIAIARRLSERHPRAVIVLVSVDGALLLPAEVGRCGAADVVRKQDLRPALLRELWRRHRPGLA